MTRFRHAAVPAFLFLCLLLGGSPQGVRRNLLLQLIGAGLLLWALWARRRTEPIRSAKFLLGLAGCWLLLVCCQLVPLPPDIWSNLPGRGPVVEAFALRNQGLSWLPWSLAPYETAAALPVMLVPLAVFAAMILLGAYRSSWCVLALAAGTFISVMLGVVQLANGGPYLYPIANFGAAAGLFANANHQATLLLMTLPFLAAIIGRQRKGERPASSKRLSIIVMTSGAIGVILLGVALNGSLAALLLVVPVGLASLLLAFPALARARRWVGLSALLLLACAATGIAAFASAGTAETSVTSRADMYQRTSAAIADSFPVGTGIGTFEAYYRLYEDPSTVDRFFVNHAHSDLLEWVLETGLPGALLLFAFLLWWGVRAGRIWRSAEPDLMALAGTIASAALLAHSLVDYPVRDAALQAVLAMSLAFMVDPRSHGGPSSRGTGRQSARHLGIDDDGNVSG